MIGWELLARLGLVLLLGQVIACGLARGLGLRLPRRIQACGIGLPILLLLPWLRSGRLLAPCDLPILANIPDAPQVAGPDTHGVFNDVIFQLLPWEAEVRRAFGDHHLPLWSDLLDGGSSPWINPQAAVLSPIAMLARLLPLEQCLLAALALKVLFAFEGAWLLARVLKISHRSALLAGLGFALGGPVMAWAIFPLSSVVAGFPWLVVSIVRLARRTTVRHLVLAGLIGAGVLLSGHPEIAFAATLATGLFAMVGARRRNGAARPLASVAFAAALGVSLAACQIVPFMLAAPQSLRANRSAPELEVNRKAEPRTYSMFPRDQARLFLSPLSPWAFGRPFHDPYSGPASWPIGAGGYMGVVLLGALPLALLSRRRRLALYLGGIGLVVLLLAAGFYPFRFLVSSLPLGQALAFDRFLPVAALPLTLMGALGLDFFLPQRRLSGAVRSWRRRRPAGSAPRAGTAVGSDVPRPPRGRLRATFFAKTGYRRPCGWLALAAVAAASLSIRHDLPLACLWLALAGAFIVGQRGSRQAGFALLGLLSLVDLLAWDYDVLPRGHRELFYPRTPLIASIESCMRDGGPWRAVAEGFGVYPSLLPMYGIADVRIDNPLGLAVQLRPLSEIFGFRPESRRYKGSFSHVEHPFLAFLNTRVVVADRQSLAGFELVATYPEHSVFRNPQALPRWFLPPSFEICTRDRCLERLALLQDARRVLLFADEISGWRPPSRPWVPDAVAVVRSSAGRVRLRLPADGEKLLATSLPFPEGWQVTANGRPLRRITVNTAYLGAIVPPRTSIVTLSFAPPGFAVGACLSGAALALLLLLGSADLLRSARSAGRPGGEGPRSRSIGKI